jgi:hypothetical protein
LAQLGHRGGVAAAQTGQHRGLRQRLTLIGAVELGGDPGWFSSTLVQQSAPQPQSTGWPQPQVALAAASSASSA